MSCLSDGLFYHHSILEGLLMLYDLPVTMLRSQPSLLNSAMWKNDCCPINCDFSSLTFLFLSSLFGGKSVLYFLWTVRKCLSTFPFFRNSNGGLTKNDNCTSKTTQWKKSPFRCIVLQSGGIDSTFLLFSEIFLPCLAIDPHYLYDQLIPGTPALNQSQSSLVTVPLQNEVRGDLFFWADDWNLHQNL